MIDSVISRVPVLVVDCQTTGATPGRDHLLEVAWSAVSGPDDPPVIHSFLLRLPAGETVPERIARLTGIASTDVPGALDGAEAWRLLEAAVAGRTPVAHFAGFEQRWLDALWAAHGGEGSRFPSILCTREIARRVLPGLPGKGLRAVAGHLGVDMGELRRAGDHVAATVFVWRALAAALASAGTDTLEDLRSQLSQPPPVHSGPRTYGLPREQRLGLPDTPGVYRFLSPGGRVLYVGKASSLKRRVNGYFTRRRGCPRTMELVTRASSLETSACWTALEAALEEARLIRELDPPYNVALRDLGRGVLHLSRDLSDASRNVDPAHPVGPVAEGSPALCLHALRGMLAGTVPPDPVDLGLAGVPLAPGALEAGLALFEEAHLPDSDPGAVTVGRLLAVGSDLWTASPEEVDAVEGEDAPRERPKEMDAAGALALLEGLLSSGAREVRLAALMRLLGWSVVRWRAASGAGVRWVRMDGGAVLGAGWLDADPVAVPPDPVPVPSLDRQRLLTPAACGLLRILVPELRRVSAEGRLEGLDLAPTGASLGPEAVKALLTFV